MLPVVQNEKKVARLSKRLSTALQRKEDFVWIDRPNSFNWYKTRGYGWMVYLSVFLCLAIVVLSVLEITKMTTNDYMGFLIAFIGICAASIIGVVVWSLQSKIYAMTQHSIITYSGGLLGKRHTEIPFEEIEAVNYREQEEGAGDLLLEVRGGGKVELPNLEKVKPVYEKIREMLKKEE